MQMWPALEEVSLAWELHKDEHSTARYGRPGEGPPGCLVCVGTCYLTRLEKGKPGLFSYYLIMESGMETI